MKRLTRHGYFHIFVTILAIVTTVWLAKETYMNKDYISQNVEEQLEEMQYILPDSMKEHPPPPDTVYTEPRALLKEETHSQILELIYALSELAKTLSPMLAPIIVYFTQWKMNFNLIEENEDSN